MAEKQFLTKKGYEERVALLENLKVVRRKEVAQKLKEAREQGDLSENAEYDAAKDEQRDIEIRIEEIDNILKNAEVVVEADLHPAVPEASSAALPLFCFSLPELHHCSLDLKHFILDNIACIRFYGYNITYFRTDQSNTNR